MNTKILNQIGLNDSEIKVYFALLELESSTVGPIIDKAKVPDSKIYLILDKLKEKGLVSFVIKNNVKHFQASDPKNILELLNEKTNEIEQQKSKLKKEIIPQIEQKRKLTEDKQEAVVYEGFEGLKSAFNLILNTLNSGEEYCAFLLGQEQNDKRVIRFFNNYNAKRIEKKIKVRFVGQKNVKTIMETYHTYKYAKLRFSSQKFPTGTYIFKGYVMTVIYHDKPTAFVIKSKKNYEQYKAYFEEVWNKSKK